MTHERREEIKKYWYIGIDRLTGIASVTTDISESPRLISPSILVESFVVDGLLAEIDRLTSVIEGQKKLLVTLATAILKCDEQINRR